MSFIPYQVDYSVKNAAKTLGFSKKRVTFKFGFANEQAIRAGESGPACRGSEHELTFVWSLASGKRQLLLDNRDLHFSESGQNGWTADRAWQHAFTLRDPSTNKTYRVHFISQPAQKEIPNSRPFDMKIGGMSYFQFNPIYQLGTERMVYGNNNNNHHHGGGGRYNRSGRDSPMSPEERQQLAAAKLASLQDLASREEEQARLKREKEEEEKKKEVLQREEGSLISFDDPTPPPMPAPAAPPGNPITSVGSSNAPNNYYASSLTLDPLIKENENQGTYGTNPYAAPPSSQTNNNPYATPYTNYTISTYGSNPYAAPPAGGAPTSNNPYAAPSSNPYAAPSNNPYAAPPAASGGNPYGAPAPSGNPYGAASTSDSMALTPYNNQGQQQQSSQPYVDATGRVSMQQQYSTGSMNYSSASSLNYSSASTPTNNNPYNMTSPSNLSYGSAPSFAQPPQQQQQQQQQPGGYGQPPIYPTTSQQQPQQYQQQQSYYNPSSQSYNY